MNESDIPRGLEVLLKKAAVDPAFKSLLLARRAGGRSRDRSDPGAERSADAPVRSCRTTGDHHRPGPRCRRNTAGLSSARRPQPCWLHAGGNDPLPSCNMLQHTTGTNPDRPPEKSSRDMGPTKGIRPDTPLSHPGEFGRIVRPTNNRRKPLTILLAALSEKATPRVSRYHSRQSQHAFNALRGRGGARTPCPPGAAYLTRALEDAGFEVDFRDYQCVDSATLSTGCLSRLPARSGAGHRPVVHGQPAAVHDPDDAGPARVYPDRTLVLGGVGSKAVEDPILRGSRGSISSAAVRRSALGRNCCPLSRMAAIWPRSGLPSARQLLYTFPTVRRITDLDTIPFPAFDKST